MLTISKVYDLLDQIGCCSFAWGGACADACTHKAIVAGTPYAILGERCDECGNCYHVCPAGAVISKGVSKD